MSVRNSNEKYILFLQLENNQSDIIYSLIEHFAQWNITVVPVTPSGLKGLRITQLTQLVVITRSLRAQIAFKALRATFLDFLLLRMKINLFHVSSFGQIEVAHRLETKNLYHYSALPTDLKSFCHATAHEIYQDQTKSATWPGGKRAKLPSMS